MATRDKIKAAIVKLSELEAVFWRDAELLTIMSKTMDKGCL